MKAGLPNPPWSWAGWPQAVVWGLGSSLASSVYPCWLIEMLSWAFALCPSSRRLRYPCRREMRQTFWSHINTSKANITHKCGDIRHDLLVSYKFQGEVYVVLRQMKRRNQYSLSFSQVSIHHVCMHFCHRTTRWRSLTEDREHPLYLKSAVTPFKEEEGS